MNNRQHQTASKAYGAARQAQVPVRVMVELYDLIFCSISHAKAASLSNDIEAEFNAICKASRVLETLDGILDDQNARTKSIAETLHTFYKTTVIQLHRAKQAKSPESDLRYCSVQRQVLSMRDAWAVVAGVPSLTATHPAKAAQ